MIILFHIICPEILLTHKPSPRQAAEPFLSSLQLEKPGTHYMLLQCVDINMNHAGAEGFAHNIQLGL